MRPITVLLAFAVLNAGCATMYRGSWQDVAFTSDPPGARVEVATGGRQCLTPCTLTLPRSRAPLAYNATMPTREPYTGELISADGARLPMWVKVPAVISRLLIIPGLIDYGSDAYYEWPEAVDFTLPPQGQGGARVVLTR